MSNAGPWVLSQSCPQLQFVLPLALGEGESSGVSGVGVDGFCQIRAFLSVAAASMQSCFLLSDFSRLKCARWPGINCPSAWRRGSSTTQRAWSLLMAKTCGERRVPAATLAGAGKRKVRQGQRRDSSGRRLLLLPYAGLIAKQRKTELAKRFI